MGKSQQIYTACACSFGCSIMGLLSIWPSYTLILLTDKNTTVLEAPMNDFESSMVGSVPSLGGMLGMAVIGIVIDKIGRQKGGVLIALPYVISWAMIWQTKSATVLLVARFISGISGGAFFVYSPIFISEVAEDSIRGALASGPVTLYCLASLISYLIGWFLSYRVIIWFNLACSVLCVVLCLMITESPMYLLRQKREEDAQVALARYRGALSDSKEILEELSRMRAQITPAIELVSLTNDSIELAEAREQEKLLAEEYKLDDGPNSLPKKKMSTLKLLFISKNSRRAFIIVGIPICMQMFMGLPVMLVYAETFFSQAAPDLSSNFCSVMLGTATLVGCVTALAITDRAGRRILIIGSSVTVGICMVFLGIMTQTSFLHAWVSAVVILVYCLLFEVGAGTVPFVLLAELFVPEVQGLASILIMESVWFLSFITIGIFPFVAKLLGITGVFYMFAAFSFLNAIISYFNVPETKGLSILQIQEALLKRRK